MYNLILLHTLAMIDIHTIVAISTGGSGAISVIRLSGKDSIEICDKFFETKSEKRLSSAKGFTLHYGNIIESGNIIDDVIVSVFRTPNSYTGENMVEISCHASQYIQSKIIELSVNNGAKVAAGGDFTMRAYANGKMDLVQAEAVADIIVSNSKSSHRLAMNQMRGGYSQEFSILRQELINLMSLIELELDFSEEDVEFADRTRLVELLQNTELKINKLVDSFKYGNVIKNGVPVAIVGSPNAGKSTLLNTLLNDDRAMVSSIAGTTRDVIEECVTISSVNFRFIDTAGIRMTDDLLENMGIERTKKSVKKANLIMLLVAPDDLIESTISQINDLNIESWQSLIVLRNKIDIIQCSITAGMIEEKTGHKCFDISAKDAIGIDSLKSYLSSEYSVDTNSNDVIISNVRHYELLKSARESLQRVLQGIENDIPSDFLAQDLRETLMFIGSITGDISTDDILHNIFANFCIGK